MDKERRTFLVILAVFAAIIFIWVLVPIFAHSEEAETTEMYVTASRLNGRATPSRRASIEARFDRGDPVSAIGWSKEHHWIEVRGGETGTVWVWWEYVTERTDEFVVWNDYGAKIKLRNAPYGRVIGYLKKNQELHIDKVVFGWGHSDKGWIELRYVTEED